MIRAFIDESEQGNVFLMAGWVTDYETWQRFNEDWRRALDAEPTIRYFKHHEAKGDPPSGEFKGWSPEQIEDKIAKLVDVVCRHEMYGVVSGLNVATHDAAYSGAAASRKQLRSVLGVTHHYQMCVFSISADILQIQLDEKKDTQTRVDFIFDEMDGLFGACASRFEEFKEDERFPPEKKAIAGTMTQANDKDVEALQAADLLAGQLTTCLRLGRSEDHYRRMQQAHSIYNSKAYAPSFEKIPQFISLFNVAWSSLRLKRATEKQVAAPPPKEQL
jgi:hypothetical protein